MTDMNRTKSFRITNNECERMISMARKDNKGRNLKTGESQRPDGRYMYRYKDELTGKRVTIYDMDLASLREQEKKINKDIDDQLITDTSVKKLTVNGLFERYMVTKNIREKTKKDYWRTWNYRIKNTLGNIRVVDFKTSHVRTFFSGLSDEGLAHSTIKSMYALLNPAFNMAVRMGLSVKSGNRNSWRLWCCCKGERGINAGTTREAFEICGEQ